jgi:hypothetical protein
MRSLPEIQFRLRQEIANLALWLHPPRLRETGPQAPGLPDPQPVIDALRHSALAAEIETIAEDVLAGKIHIFGEVIETGPHIHWRRDYKHGHESGLQYLRRVPYLNFDVAGDHKWVWEPNRHQHLITLAQAWRFTGNRAYLEAIVEQVTDWIDQNPCGRGINWTSTLEVAFRALSWIWVDHLAGAEFDAAFRERYLSVLQQHGYHIEYNLSYYFSRNTHLMGEAVALHAIGALYPFMPAAAKWKATGGEIVEREMLHQVHADGSHFEHSSYYHVYSIDFFLFHRLLATTTAAYDERLRAMAEYLAALCWRDGSIPLIGDDDGGRLFHPFGQRPAFSRGTLAACAVYFGERRWLLEREDLHPVAAWWFGERALACAGAADAKRQSANRLFPDIGMAVLEQGDVQVRFDAGPFGWGGHSHSDSLAFVVRRGDEDVLIDSGTYTYISNPEWRNRFRGSAGHNTVRIDERDQAVPAGPFRWTGRPDTRILAWSAEAGFIDAECRYAGFRHRRRLLLAPDQTIFVLDTVEGPGGEHAIEQFWHPAPKVALLHSGAARFGPAVLQFAGTGVTRVSCGGENGWRSTVLGTKHESDLICRAAMGSLPRSMGAAVVFSDADHAVLELTGTATGIRLQLGQWAVDFPSDPALMPAIRQAGA